MPYPVNYTSGVGLWCTVLSLIVLLVSGSTGRPSSESEDTDTVDLSRMKFAILNELGLQISLEQAAHLEMLPKANISQAELRRGYAEYVKRVRMRKLEERALVTYGHKARRQIAKRIVQTFNPVSIHTYDNVETRLDFNVNLDVERRSHLRIRKALVKLPSGCCYFDLERNETLWGRVEVTTKFVSWVATSGQQSNLDLEPFGVTLYCTATANEDPFVREHSLLMTSLKVVASQIDETALATHKSWRLRKRRSYSLHAYENHPTSIRSRDCDKTRHGKTCCRRSMKINFETLNIRDLILEPKEFDAHMCTGRCNARRVPFATTHAMLQQTLHQTKGRSELIPRPCCTPSKLRHLDVLHTVPGTDTLKITILANAIVEECSCS